MDTSESNYTFSSNNSSILLRSESCLLEQVSLIPQIRNLIGCSGTMPEEHQTIDSTLGLRCTMFGYQYSEILRSLMCVYLCGGKERIFDDMNVTSTKLLCRD